MAVTNFIPQLWSARLLAHLDKTHVYANLVNRDYEGEISSFGDTVKINSIGDITVSDYKKNTDINAPEELSGDQRVLTIDQAKYFNFQIDDVDNAQTNPKLMDKAMARAAYAMSEQIDLFIANKYTEIPKENQLGDDTTPITLDKTNVYESLVDLGTLLTEANVPKEGRWVVVAPWVTGLLLKNDNFIHATAMGDSVITNGLIGKAAGFRIYESNNTPNTTKTKYKFMAGIDAGISYAEQIIKTEAYRMEKRFGDAVKGLHVYGGKVVQPKALALLTANKKA